jgi:hypothetical protein
MLIGAALAASAAPAAPAGNRLVYRVTGSGWDLGASGDCADGSVRYDIVGARGSRIGTATLCVVEATRREAGGGVVIVTERVIETDAFAGGWLRWRSFQEYRSSGDGARASISIRGDVTGGTGRFARARGRVSGAGTRRGERLDVRVAVSLRGNA